MWCFWEEESSKPKETRSQGYLLRCNDPLELERASLVRGDVHWKGRRNIIHQALTVSNDFSLTFFFAGLRGDACLRKGQGTKECRTLLNEMESVRSRETLTNVLKISGRKMVASAL